MNDPLKLEEWESKYSPVLEESYCQTPGDVKVFEYWDEALAEAEIQMEENKTSTMRYRHIWTRVEGDSGKIIILNGGRLCNRLNYVVTVNPWGTEDHDKNADVYVEVTEEE